MPNQITRCVGCQTKSPDSEDDSRTNHQIQKIPNHSTIFRRCHLLKQSPDSEDAKSNHQVDAKPFQQILKMPNQKEKNQIYGFWRCHTNEPDSKDSNPGHQIKLMPKQITRFRRFKTKSPDWEDAKPNFLIQKMPKTKAKNQSTRFRTGQSNAKLIYRPIQKRPNQISRYRRCQNK